MCDGRARYRPRHQVPDEPVTSPGEISGGPAGYQVGNYTFDDAGRLGTVADQDASSFTYAYTPDSYHLPASLTGGPVAVTYTWEAERDALDTVTNDVPANTPSTVSRYDYTVNHIGQRESVLRSGEAHGGGDGTITQYLYNAAGEMTDSETYDYDPQNPPESPPENPLPAGGLAGYHRAYAFDAIGNRLDAEEGTAPNVDYVPDAVNGYTTVGPDALSYDDDGNLLDDGTYTYTWDGDVARSAEMDRPCADPEGDASGCPLGGERRQKRLVALEPNNPGWGSLRYSATFDYLGRRVTKETEGYFYATWMDYREESFLYEGWNLAATYWGEWGGAPNNQRTYTWGRDLSGSIQGASGVGGLLAAHEEGGIFTGFHLAFLYDGNGNVVQVIDQSGATAARYDYGPFGQLVDLGPAGPGVTYSYALENPFRFSTKFADHTYQADAPTYPSQYRDTFYYYGYRSYDPQVGRWLSRDPIEERGGRNLLGFVGNSPANDVDVLGNYKKAFQCLSSEKAILTGDENRAVRRLSRAIAIINAEYTLSSLEAKLTTTGAITRPLTASEVTKITPLFIHWKARTLDLE